jgi:hypothetical protein
VAGLTTSNEHRVVKFHVLVNEYGAVATIGRADEAQLSPFCGLREGPLIVPGRKPLTVRQHPYLQGGER